MTRQAQQHTLLGLAIDEDLSITRARPSDYATLDGDPAPLPDFSAALRQPAPHDPRHIPTELQQLLTAVVRAIHDAR